jgi:hypothetical protein
VTVLLAGAGYLLAFVVADHWLIDGGFPFGARLAMLIAVGGFIGGWTVWKILLPYWKRVTALYAAREIEAAQPELKSSLLTLVDLRRAQRAVAPHILSAMEKRAALQLEQIDVDQAVDRRPLMRLSVALLSVVVGLCLYTVLSPKPIGASILRALVPIADVGVATRTRIDKVDPGDATILSRSQLDVTVDVAGQIPPEATLLYSTRDGSLIDEPVILRDTGEGLNRFRGTLSGPNGRGLLQDFTYRITAGDAVSATYSVLVRQAPYATVESVAYAFPSYMGLDPKTQAGGEIDAWEGTQVTIRATTNMPVAGAMLKLHDTEDTALQAEERPMRVVNETQLELTIPWTLEFRSDGSYPHYYSIDVRTADNQRDPVPRLYGLTIRRDLPPEIKLLHPSGDVVLPANAVLPVSFTARDPDFMLRSVRMHFEKGEQPLESKSRHLYDAPPFRAELSGRGEIDLASFPVQPGEVLTFWLEAWDNMAPLGSRPGNRTVTPKINIAIADPVSREQVEQQRAEEEAAAQERLEDAQTQSNSGTQDVERPANDERQDENGNDAAADQATPPEPADASGEPAQGDPAAAQEPGTEQAPGQQGADADQDKQSPQPQAERQLSADERSPDGQPRESGQQAGGADQSQGGSKRSSESPGNDGDSGRQAARDGASRQSKSPAEPGQEAADDEALERLFQEYADEIRQQREQERQQKASDQRGDDGNQAENAGDPQGGSKPQPGSDSPSEPSPESSDPAAKSGEPGTGEGDETGNPQQDNAQRPGRNAQDKQSDDPTASGDERSTGDAASPAKDQDSPEEGAAKSERSGGPQDRRPNSDPRANQDPRTADEAPSPRGPQPGEASRGENGEQRGDSPPMPGEGEPSSAPESAEAQPSGDSAAQGEPGAKQPGESKPGEAGRSPQSRPDGDAQDQQPGDAGGSDADRQKPGEPARTGNQPDGPDKPDPGSGRPKGQRSEQPSPGERGRSQQSSEGTPGGNESGAGDQSDSPGNQSEATGSKSGSPSPGEGQPSQDKPGQRQVGEGGAPSKPGEDGASKPAGDESSSGSESETQPGGKESQDGGGDKTPTANNKSQEGSPDGQPESPSGGDKAENRHGAQPTSEAGEANDAGKDGGGSQENSPATEQSGSGEQPQGSEAGAEKGGDKSRGKDAGKASGENSDNQGGASGNESGGSPQQGSGEGGGEGDSPQQGTSQSGGGRGQPGGARSGLGGTGSGNSQQPGAGTGAGSDATGEGAEAAHLDDKKRVTELVLQKLQDELRRGDVSPELLQELGWTEGKLRDFMERLDRRLSDTGEDQTPESQARRRQFDEILRGIEYSSEGARKTADAKDRPVTAGSGGVPRLPAPTEFQKAEELFQLKKSRETRSK